GSHAVLCTHKLLLNQPCPNCVSVRGGPCSPRCDSIRTSPFGHDFGRSAVRAYIEKEIELCTSISLSSTPYILSQHSDRRYGRWLTNLKAVPNSATAYVAEYALAMVRRKAA